MKLSIKWIEQYTDVKLERDELVKRVGAQLGAVEGVEDWGSYYDDAIVVAEIIEANDHPDADKLGVYRLKTGDGEVTVCAGDKTLKVGDRVGYIAPGAHVPESVRAGEPFKITERELRGVLSQGMMGSAKELIMSDSHEGVLKLDTDSPIGTPLSEAYELDDLIIDVENKMFTHRPDLFGILGLAREIAGIQDIAFTSPEWYVEAANLPEPTAELPLHVEIKIPELCPRFSALTFKDVSIKPSPIQMQSYLTRVGMRPINNVVDITNYGMYLTGQPTHAFDYDKVAERSKGTPTIVVRNPNEDEEITLLDGRTIKPHSNAAMVATNQELISVGGSMGGADTEVDENTKNIILEAASWDLYSIRRTSFTHGIFTDAVTRFNKGQSPRQTIAALGLLSSMLCEQAEASVASSVVDVYPRPADTAQIEVTNEFVNERLGSDFEMRDVAHILKNVEIQTSEEGGALKAEVPFWRTDLELAEDLVEEVGRLHGYDNLPIVVPSRLSKPNFRSDEFRLKAQIRNVLAAAGARDTLTYNFVSSGLLGKAGFSEDLIDTAYRIRNSLSPELECMRISLLPSLIEKVNPNLRSGYGTFALFEINKVHNKLELDSEKLPIEHTNVAGVVVSDAEQNGSAYYQAKAYVDYLCKELGVTVTYRPATDGDSSLTQGRAAKAIMSNARMAAVYINDRMAGFVGEFASATKQRFKLPAYSAGFELDVALLQPQPHTYMPISRFPSTSQDVTLETPDEIDYADLEKMVERALQNESFSVAVVPAGIYRANPEAPRRITFRITFQSAEHTLKTAEINEVIAELVARVKDMGVTQI